MKVGDCLIIADMFNRLKYMDRRGSGFKKILGNYRIQPQYKKSMEPEFNSDNDSFLLVLMKKIALMGCKYVRHKRRIEKTS